jgi:hypothetical protein
MWLQQCEAGREDCLALKQPFFFWMNGRNSTSAEHSSFFPRLMQEQIKERQLRRSFFMKLKPDLS